MNNLNTKILLSYFQLCGFCQLTSLEVFTKSRFTQLLYLWSYVHLITLSAVVFLTIYYARQIVIMKHVISAVTDILKMILPILSHYVILIESLRTNHIKYQFWHKIGYMDKFFLTTSTKMKHASTKKFLIKCSLILAVTTAIDLFTLIRVHPYHDWQNHIAATFYTFVICRSEMLFCVFFIDTLTNRTNILTQRLNQMRITNQNQLISIRCCRKAFEMLWLSVEDINQAFGT